MIGIIASGHAVPLARDIQRRLREAGLNSWLGTDLETPPWARTQLLISIGEPVTAADIDRAPKLRALVSPVLGYDFFDVDAATRRGIAIVNGEVAENRESMAEATIMLTLALLYRLDDARANFDRADGSALPHGRMLKGKTVGIIGAGGIGRAIVSRLQPWGCHLLVYSRSGAAPGGAVFTPLDQLVAASDVLIVATNLDDATRHLISRDLLDKLKPAALVVNTARGPIIDEAALLERLDAGRIGGAALDVFEVEPVPADHAIRRVANVILTPHAIGHTEESSEAVPRKAVENILELAAGRLPSSCRNLAVEPRWIAPNGLVSF